MAKKFNLAALVPEMEAVSNSDTPRITMIPITDLEPNCNNFYDTSNIDDLVDSIDMNGLLEPLCVFRRTQFSRPYLIFSGHRRFKALLRLRSRDGGTRWDEVPCIVYPDPHDANREMVMLIHANSTGRILSSWEKAEQALRLKKALIAMRESGAELPGKIRDLVAEEMQMSSSKLARLDAIQKNLTQRKLKNAWKRGEIGESVAYELSKLFYHQQQNVVAMCEEQGIPLSQLKVKDVNAFALRVRGVPKPEDVSNLDTPTVIGADMAEPGSDRTAVAIYHRCLVDEPEEGQTALVLDPFDRSVSDVVVYRDGQFVDERGRGEALEVKSSMWWLPLPPFPWEQR